MTGSNSYPIAILFLVVGLCAIVLAIGLGHVDWNNITVEGVRTVTGLGLGTAMVGGLIGLHSYRRWVGMVRGFGVGLLLGLTLGSIVYVPRDQLARVVRLEILGSLGIIALGIAVRLAKSDPLWASNDRNREER